MRLLMCAAAVLVAAVGAAAEERTGDDGSGTTVSVLAGLTTGSMSGTAGAVGATLVQELGRRWAVEASATYLGEGMGGDSLALNAGVLFHFRPSSERAAPYLALGGGLYRTSFHGRGRDGPMPVGPGMPGGGMHGGPYGPVPGGGTYGQMPRFYARRMPVGPEGPWPGDEAFNDPALSVGGGVRIRLGSSMFLRPDGRVLVAFADDESLTVGVVTVSFGWRF